MSKLTQEELQIISTKRQVVDALNSWHQLLDYLKGLVEADSQVFIDTVVKKRLQIPKKTKVSVSLKEGSVERIK